MASVAPAQLDQATHDELCCTYAALLLYDAQLDISADKIDAIVKASGNTVGAHCPALFA
jgi:large subunit ribosomal protein LP1